MTALNCKGLLPPGSDDCDLMGMCCRDAGMASLCGARGQQDGVGRQVSPVMMAHLNSMGLRGQRLGKCPSARGQRSGFGIKVPSDWKSAVRERAGCTHLAWLTIWFS